MSTSKHKHQHHPQQHGQPLPSAVKSDLHTEEVDNAKPVELVENLVVDTEATYDKIERLFDTNKKYVYGALIAAIIPVLLYLAYKKFYVAPMETKANAAMYKAQENFAKGDYEGSLKDFEKVINNYGPTKTANLAHLYAGVCNLKTKKFDKAIEQLEDFNSNDGILNTMALSALGDAYSEKNNMNEAISYYKKAANANKNAMTTPMNLFKAALALETLGKKEEALKLYEQIRNEFPKSSITQQIDKYIVRAGGAI